MADLDLAELRRLAENATRVNRGHVRHALLDPGPFGTPADDSLVTSNVGELLDAVMALIDSIFPEPAVVLQLLDRLEAAEARADAYEAAAETAARLRVEPESDRGPDEGRYVSLMVDAEALMAGPLDVRYWRLYPVAGTGDWVHPESGEHGPLSVLLLGLARCYQHTPTSAVPGAVAGEPGGEQE